MKTVFEEKDLNKVFGYKEMGGHMTLEELEERTSGLYSYKGFCVAFGFAQHIDGQTFQTVRVWEQIEDAVSLRFTTDGLVATDTDATRLVIKWAKQNIDRILAA